MKRSLASILRREKPPQAAPPGAGGDGAAPVAQLPGPEGDPAEMGFLDHLEELRWRIVKGAAGIVVGIIVALIFSDFVIDTLLLGPAKPDFFTYEIFGIELKDFDLQNRTVAGQFWAWMGTLFAVGVIIGFPVLVYQLWAFVEPGLYPHEKKGMRFISAFASGMFMLGVVFGYMVIVPLALFFFSNFTISDTIVNEFDITRFLGSITVWVFGAGLMFELPVVTFILSKMGLLTPALLRKSRKMAFVVILITAAILTPPDPVSQLLMALPLLGLYEVSILISARVNKKRQKEIDEALA